MVNYLFYVFFFSSLVFFSLFVFMWVIFGKLISLQIKRWMLASRGYVEVEHISPTNVRNYFILRPKDSKFDMSSGFFHYIPECLNRKGQILKKFDKELLNKSNPEIDPKEVEGLSDSEREEYVKRLTAEWIELKNVYKVIVDRKYDPELLTRKMGMPVITYYGDNPDPINFSDRKKVYGSGVIKDMYLRLLLTQRYKDFRMFAIIVTVSLVIVAVCVVGLYSLHNSDVKNFARCVTLFNQTSSQYVAILNQTIQANIQSSGGVVTI